MVQVQPLAVPGRDDGVRGDVRVVGLVDRAVRFGQRRAGRQGRAVGAVERERAAAGRGGDGVAAVVDHLVVVGAQADQVVQVGAAAVDPVLDVVQVGPAGLAARVPAPAMVPFPGRPADRGAGAAPAPAQGQHRAASPWVIHDKAAVQAIICAVDTLMAGPSSTWHRAGSAGSPGTRAGAGGVSAETPATSAAGAAGPASMPVPA